MAQILVALGLEPHFRKVLLRVGTLTENKVHEREGPTWTWATVSYCLGLKYANLEQNTIPTMAFGVLYHHS